MSQVKNLQQRINDLTAILHGKPAAPVSALPMVWQRLARSSAGTGLSDAARGDYVTAARLFRYHDTPLGMEALSMIGKDFQRSAYPDLEQHLQMAISKRERNTVKTLQALFGVFGYDVPAAFYNALLGSLIEENDTVGLRLFKNKKELMRDRLWDAVLHAMLLVTPVGLYIHSVFSQHGLRFIHMMNCSCKIDTGQDEPFFLTLDDNLKSAYLQNLVAAALEQYGVNASTSGKRRGF